MMSTIVQMNVVLKIGLLFTVTDVLMPGTAQREGLGGALAPPLFCKNKNKLNKK